MIDPLQACGMTKKLKKLDEQVEARISELARRLSDLKKERGSKVKSAWPEGIRAEILAMWRESGMAMDPFGARVGVSGQTLGNWRRGEVKKEAKAAPKPKKQFQEVRVVPERVPKVVPPSRRSFELALPGGARVTGLGMEEITQLLGMKGASR